MCSSDLEFVLENGRDGYEAFAREVDAETSERLAHLQKDYALVAQSNEPTVLPEGEFQYLQQIATREYEDIRGERRLLIDPEEARILSIRKGNLDPAERVEIESHVTHTPVCSNCFHGKKLAGNSSRNATIRSPGFQSIPMATVAIPSEVFLIMAISLAAAPIRRAAEMRTPS